MTDHTMSKHEAAMAAVNAAESSARVTGAMLVLDALDAHAADLSSFDRYDFAYATWQVMIDGDTPIADATGGILMVYHRPRRGFDLGIAVALATVLALGSTVAHHPHHIPDSRGASSWA